MFLRFEKLLWENSAAMKNVLVFGPRKRFAARNIATANELLLNLDEN
jgi:hypothetical protein